MQVGGMVLEVGAAHVGAGECLDVEACVRGGEDGFKLRHELLARVPLRRATFLISKRWNISELLAGVPLRRAVHIAPDLARRGVAHLVQGRPHEAVHGGELLAQRQRDGVGGRAVERLVAPLLMHRTVFANVGVDSIRKRYRRGEPVAAIARELGVSRDTVYKYARMDDLSLEPPRASKRR